MTLTLAELTTLRVGGPIGTFYRVDSEADFIDAVREADAAGTRLLVLGGGSNILAADAGFDGVVVQDARTSIEVDSEDSCGGASITVAAGTPWEATVSAAIDNGWMGLETLTGIPGSTGATPVQNVGAYGYEVASVISTVRTWDRSEGRVCTFAVSNLGLGYRTSILKRSIGPEFGYTPRYVVLSVGFQLPLATRSAPIKYSELATTLGVELGTRVEARDVRDAVRGLRGSKGMLLDGGDHDTWSAGSFFTNPILPASLIPKGAPAFDVDDLQARLATAQLTPVQRALLNGGDALKKTSAAWLISRSGVPKGFQSEGGGAGISTKHVLALTNRGGATAGEVVDLARYVRDRVKQAHGVMLVPEPVFVGVDF